MNTAYETSRTEEMVDDDAQLAMELDTPTGVSPSAFPHRVEPLFGAQAAHEVPPSPRSRVLLRLLSMADSYLRSGSPRQALEMYFDLTRSHPGTPEAEQAEERILKVARLHEKAGELHNARAIYEQLI